MPRMVVILNGASSSGKTTLAKALQDVLNQPFLVIGMDTVVYALPRRYLNEPARWAEVFDYDYVEGEISRITPTAYGHRLVRGLHSAVAALAQGGLDLIVDHVILERAWAEDLEARMEGLAVVRVGVMCPLEVLQERERSRHDRTLGQAGAQIDLVHTTMRYDVVVDTSQATPVECARLIAAALPI